MDENKIRHFREEKGLSQRQLAKMLGTSQQQIQRYETGVSQMKLDFAMRLTTALGIEAEQLFPGIRARFSKLHKQKEHASPEAVADALAASGLDGTEWTVAMELRGGIRRAYFISKADVKRLGSVLADVDYDPRNPHFFEFESDECLVTINLEHLLFCQFLWDAPNSEAEREKEESWENVRVWMTTIAEPLKFKVSPECPREGEGDLVPFAADFLAPLDDLAFADFEDVDGETVHLRTKEIMLVEADSEILHPDIYYADDESSDEAKEGERQKSSKKLQ